MKKLCFLVCSILILSTILPFHVQADDATLTYDELIELSCSVFPEYADTIMNPTVTASSTYTLNDPVVISETRAVSENETMTYQETASGYAFLSFSGDWMLTSISQNGNLYERTGSLYVCCTTSPYIFHLRDFSYAISPNGMDYISDFGSYAYSSTCNVSHLASSTASRKQYENSAGPAYANYNLIFYPADYSAFVPASCLVSLDVGDNALVVTVNGSSTTYPYTADELS